MKKIVIVFCFLIFNNHDQLARMPVSKLTDLFNRDFLSVTSRFVRHVSLLAQVPLTPAVEDRIFRLKCEDGAHVFVLATNEVFENQKKAFMEMKSEGCLVGVLPDDYTTVGLEGDLDPEQAAFVIGVQRDSNNASLMVALLQYYTELEGVEQTKALFGTHDTLLRLENSNNEFNQLQNWFNEMAEKSDY